MRERREISIVQLLGLVEAHQDVAEAAKKFERVYQESLGSASYEVDRLLLDRAQENLREALDRLEQKEEFE